MLCVYTVMCWYCRVQIKLPKSLPFSSGQQEKKHTVYSTSSSWLYFAYKSQLRGYLLCKIVVCKSHLFTLTELTAPPGYTMNRDGGEESERIRCRDVISPINELDVQSNSSRGQKHTSHFHVWGTLYSWGTNSILRYDTPTDDSPFFDNDMPTMRSSSSSSEGLPHVTGLNWEGSVESNEVSTAIQPGPVNHQTGLWALFH